MPHGRRFEQLCSEVKSRIREISAADAARARSDGAVLVDVREALDFEQEHAAGAVHLSKGVIEMKIEQHVPDIAAAIVCYCGGGNRSALAADNLQKMGYENVRSLSGGFKAWQEAGLPTES
jgi:phage shock protein E